MTVLNTITPLLSDQNHFQFGYERNGQFFPFEDRQNKDDLWSVYYGRSRRMPLSFRAECSETARIIQQNTELPITVLFSGGVDSEVVVRAFQQAGIHFTAGILRFHNDLNLHDYIWAVLVCEELRIPYKIYELDLLKFWENESYEYAKATSCVTPQLLSTMWLVDQVEGYAVIGSGEHYLRKRAADFSFDHPYGIKTREPGLYPRTTWDLIEKEKIAAWYRHFIVRGRDGCPGFFQYTPELMLSWLVDPMGLDLTNDRIDGRWDSMGTKLKFYQQHYNLKERTKYSGFEKVLDADYRLRKELYGLYPTSDWAYATPVPLLMQTLSPSPESYPPKAFYQSMPHLPEEQGHWFPYRYEMKRPF